MFRNIFIATIISFLFYSCNLLPIKNYKIMQNGMYPTIAKGEVVWAKKNPYKHVDEVNRGDIVVFTVKENNNIYDYIWRVIAIPGDTIHINDSKINLNSKVLNLNKIDEDSIFTIFEEENINCTYSVAYEKSPSSDQNYPQLLLIVKNNEFFVMGDNRHNAYDSRYHGTIKFESITAKVLRD